MADSFRHRPQPTATQPFEGEPGSEFYLGDYLDVARRRWPLFAVGALVGLVTGIVYFLVTPPSYQATASLLIERQSTLALVGEGLVDLGGASSSQYYATQLELLQSRGMAERVVERLDLARNPAFDPDRAEVAEAGGTASDQRTLAEQGRRLLANLSVRPRRDTYLVDITYTSSDPDLAAEIANSLAETYIDWGIEERTTTVGQATTFLASQIETLRQEVRDKEVQLQQYSRTSDILALDASTTPLLRRLEALNQDYTDAVSERIAKQARYNEVMNAPKETVAEMSTGGRVAELRREVADLRQEYETKLNTYKADWPEMVELERQIEQREEHLRQVIGEEVETVRQNARAEYQTALRHEQSLAEEIKRVKDQALDQNSEAARYANLRSEIETRQNLLDQLMKRQSETEVASRLQGEKQNNVRVVDEAVVPARPFRPDLERSLGLGGGLGLLLGLGFAFFLEYMDRSIKTSEVAERTLGIPVLAVIPDLEAATASYGTPSVKRKKRSGKGRAKIVERKGGQNLAIELIPAVKPQLAVSESYRSLRTALMLSSAERLTSIAVTSSHAKEGKTSTATNLAVVMAQAGRRVLLVDADLRKPRLHKIFGLSNRAGLVGYLVQSNSEPGDVFQATGVEGLQVCTSGPIPPNPSELLASGRLSEMLMLAKQRFDVVIFDTPPVLAVADPLLVGHVTDGMILCLRAGRVLREDAREAHHTLEMAEVRVLGSVLNGHHAADSRYGRYGRYYHSSRVYGRRDTDSAA